MFKEMISEKEMTLEPVETIKNGIIYNGFRIKTDDSLISPVIYLHEGMTAAEFFDAAEKALEEAKKISFDPSILKNRRSILENIFPAVQRKSTAPCGYLTGEVLNLETFLRLVVGEGMSIRVTEDLLKDAGISSDEAWTSAEENFLSCIRIRSIAEILGFSAGIALVPLYAVTMEDGLEGAACLMYPDIFRAFCLKVGAEGIVILPSSTQEVLIAPDDGTMSYAEFASLVNFVNETEVSPEIRLDPVVYRYDLISNEIKIAARF